ncbi:hypothetical protein GH714_027295 [Hevea brasiliensis]|uniref:Peptidase S8/S53 domain-containing protein n=1 Tax=Hevea brasiliensis TaxID=3981 RepID=A0A6A6LUD0_HEVBR|nr:hypothetical protein GH714_027295 [Hevea brasiliensis]
MIREYVKTHQNPTALLSFGGTVLNVRPSPVVAAFSSRGPNLVTPQILKPDLIGPGVNILAAWSEAVGPTGLETDSRKTQFNIISGTSMSCPHISGVAALLKAAYPRWSPSAIKSALMTTAYVVTTPIPPCGMLGALLVHFPTLFLMVLAMSTHTELSLRASSMISQLTRSVYEVAVTAPPAVVVKVNPTKLVFRNVGDKVRYTVTFVAKKGVNQADSMNLVQ